MTFNVIAQEISCEGPKILLPYSRFFPLGFSKSKDNC